MDLKTDPSVRHLELFGPSFVSRQGERLRRRQPAASILADFAPVGWTKHGQTAELDAGKIGDLPLPPGVGWAGPAGLRTVN